MEFKNKELNYRNFRCCDLSHADFSGSSLLGTDFSYASLYGADFTGCIIDGGTNFYHADLRESKGLYLPMICPTDGMFYGWKAALDADRQAVLVHLLIPADAKRVSGTIRFCRCDWAVVMKIEGAEEAYSFNDPETIYRPDNIVMADSFDEDRWNNFGHGIYFFIDRAEAVEYAKNWRM